jgi:membrane-anchored mycosin MYCP
MTQEPALSQEGARNDSELEELAVDLEHLKRVTDMLDSLKVAWTAVGQSEELGLALLSLPALDKSVASIPTKDLEEAETYLKRVAPDASFGKLKPLDKLLTVVRIRFASVNGGWRPTIGKNRYVQAVAGMGEINGGGKRSPMPLPDGESFALPESKGGNGRVRVGVLDTAIVPLPALAGRYIAGTTSIINPDEQPGSVYWGHAAFVAGLILAEAPNAELDVRAVLERDGGDSRAWDVAKAMVAFAGSGVKVLNLSFGCLTDDGRPPLVLERAVDKLDPEIVLVAAAGNHGDTEMRHAPLFPAALDEVVAVDALDRDGHAAFSPSDAPWIDLSAPGVDVESLYVDDEVPIAYRDANGSLVNDGTRTFHGAATWSGTSFSAATITGRIAAGIGPGKSAREVVRDMKEK